MPSFEVTLEVEETIADEVSAELFAIGAEAIEVRDREGLKLPGVILPPDGKSWLICGFTESSREDLEARLTQELAQTPYKYTVTSFQLRDDTDWANKWKEFYRPLRVGDNLWVSPSWEKAPDVPGAVVIRLDPEMAFGTGQHPTTRLCLQLVERLLTERQREIERLRILDVGTGSGILAIGAALLGAKHIVGVDNDQVSVETAKANAERNGVAAMCKFWVGAMPQAAPHVGETFDIILANILADPLIEMAPTLRSLRASAGQVVLSGLLNDQADRVIAAYAAEGFTVEDHLREDEWSALLLS
ncbi:MAG: 50S ribosomal protein L11 methyltransferase [Deltaproteobacteria bacterium]|nr:50S ribosomal protein L11 methyltransferase [Deltaproteobacteria bacterium]